ncbi:hypothetical protein KKJ04_21735 [Xenorhabdus bovienii]|uniref:hypothetical protein n=1 Tax=Xenorhabdus bovienii TaxID=40576 RepID=UPI0023B26144|nr:hypothetical protein [Xenorhabdus bovienii]MDE9448065.1 hypothetical protein [Xenorhabdus bovienii]
MTTLTPFLQKIELILQNSQRPETDLYQLFSLAAKESQTQIVVAMIGKLIEQRKRLNSRS